MNPRDVEKLLGGYATGTLSDAEREALFTEAMHNQSLFDKLADEEALRELLSDPAARRRLLELVQSPPATLWQRLNTWLWRPMPLAAAGAVAVAVVAVVLVRQAAPPVEQAQFEVALRRESSDLREQPASPAPAQPAGKPLLDQASPQGKDLPAAPPPPPPPPPAVRVSEPEPKAASAPRAEAATGVYGGAVPPVAGSVGAREDAAPAAVAMDKSTVAENKQERDEIRQRSAVQLAAARANTPAAPALGYRVERREPDGRFSTAALDGLRAGDFVRLVVEPRQSGLLLVTLAGQTLFSEQVASGQPYIVPRAGSLPSSAGERNVLISLSVPQVVGQAFRLGATAEAQAQKEEQVLKAAAAPQVTLRLIFK